MQYHHVLYSAVVFGLATSCQCAEIVFESSRNGFSVQIPEGSESPVQNNDSVQFSDDATGLYEILTVRRTKNSKGTLDDTVQATCQLWNSKPIGRHDRRIQGNRAAEFCTASQFGTTRLVQHHLIVHSAEFIHHLRTSGTDADRKRRFFDSFCLKDARVATGKETNSSSRIRTDGVYRCPRIDVNPIDSTATRVFDYLVFTKDGMAYFLQGDYHSATGYTLLTPSREIRGGLRIHETESIESQPAFIIDWLNGKKEKPSSGGRFSNRNGRFQFSYGSGKSVVSYDGGAESDQLIVIRSTDSGSPNEFVEEMKFRFLKTTPQEM